MARPQQEVTPKQQALLDLEDVRAALARHASLAVEEWSPRAVLTRSFEKHAVLWISGAAVAGLILVRVVRTPPMAREDISSSPTRNRSLLTLLLGPLYALVRKSAAGYASQWFQSYLQRHRPVSPDESGDNTV